VSLDPGTIITSIHNPAIRRARSLLRRKGRTEERAFLVEGVRAVRDIVAAGVRPTVVYIREDEDWHEWVPRLQGGPLRVVTADVLSSMSDVPHPQGVIAVVPMDALSTQPRHDVWRDDLILVADGVADPGNLGTLLRSAAGAGVTEVLVSPQSVDPFNPKVVRAAMGAHVLVSPRQAPLEDIASRISQLPLIVLADAQGHLVEEQIPWTQPCALIVGGEARGAGSVLASLANAYVRIPLARNLESLNAGVAGSHLLLEAARQRRHALGSQRPVRET
jgi:TrmH family RNA methyltransferase